MVLLSILLLMSMTTQAAEMLLIDNFQNNDKLSLLGTPWRLVTDSVMGGVSTGLMSLKEIEGRRALCISGNVSMQNNGGFIQAVLNLKPAGYFNAERYTGFRILVRGNGESYNLHLKTADTRLPWQSYRSTFRAGPEWREISLPFQGFESYRLTTPMDRMRLSRFGLVAIGRAFTADLCVSQISLY